MISKDAKTIPLHSVEIFGDLAAILRVLRAARYVFLLAAVGFILWEVFAVVGLGENLTFWLLEEFALVSVLYPCMVWIGSRWIQTLLTGASERHRELLEVEISELRRWEDTLRTREKRIQELARTSILAYEEERHRAALEMDDRIVQPLAAAFYQLQAMEKFMTWSGPRPERAARDASAILQQCVGESQHFMAALYPTGLNEFGILRLMESELSHLGVDIGCRVRFDASLAVMPQHVSITLYRVFSEALANVRRHAAGVRETTVYFAYKNEGFTLQVRDDGPGFDPEAMEEKRLSSIASMRWRVETLGGTLEVVSIPDHGTEVTAIVPIEGGNRIER